MNVEIENTLHLSWLIHQQNEPLFLKPDGVRTRYCIGWNGYGRYLPGTLKVTYNGLPCNISEESNGIFYSFSVAPSGNYDDYTVTYIARPLDYAFSIGDELGGYPDEEYFLFPNWNTAKGEGDGFWIGKYKASSNAGIPQSKKDIGAWSGHSKEGAINASKSKGNDFSIVRNRQWVSIALWSSHMDIHVLDSTDTHNRLENGINQIVGSIWEITDGLENRLGEIWVFDEDNETYIDSGVSLASSPSGTITDIVNDTQDILNEGIPRTTNGGGYIPSNLDNDALFNLNNQSRTQLLRCGWASDGIAGNGFWAFGFDRYNAGAGQYGFRLSKDLI